MENIQHLSITGYQNHPIRTTFVRQNRGTNHLGLVFPGLSYAVSMPVLFYPGRLLSQVGADVLLVDSHYDQLPAYSQATNVERDRRLAADADAALETALLQGGYQRVTLVGKSIGTLAMAHLLQSHPHLPDVCGIWLTPLIKIANLRQSIMAHPHRALFVAGTADPYFDARVMDEVQQATGCEVLLIEGADHSLEIAGDVVRSIAVMRQVMERVKMFIEQ